MGRLRNFLGLFRRRQRPPKVRIKTLGHRGIAAGSLKPGEQDLSPENIAKWEILSAEEIDRYLYFMVPLVVHSTNVEAMQYLYGENRMIVKYLDGGFYQYENVTEQEALAMAKAQSKGGAVWDNFRVRGSKTAHKKPYQEVSSFRSPSRSLRLSDLFGW